MKKFLLIQNIINLLVINIFLKVQFLILKIKTYIAQDININLKKIYLVIKIMIQDLKDFHHQVKMVLTTINKGVFTSCKKNDKCPPWTIQADKITYDKNKKQINYDNALVKVYDIPVLYFPKFFHPGPTVKRQSGFLVPHINNSNILGSSLANTIFLCFI